MLEIILLNDLAQILKNIVLPEKITKEVIFEHLDGDRIYKVVKKVNGVTGCDMWQRLCPMQHKKYAATMRLSNFPIN